MKKEFLIIALFVGTAVYAHPPNGPSNDGEEVFFVPVGHEVKVNYNPLEEIIPPHIQQKKVQESAPKEPQKSWWDWFNFSSKKPSTQKPSAQQENSDSEKSTYYNNTQQKKSWFKKSYDYGKEMAQKAPSFFLNCMKKGFEYGKEITKKASSFVWNSLKKGFDYGKEMFFQQKPQKVNTNTSESAPEETTPQSASTSWRAWIEKKHDKTVTGITTGVSSVVGVEAGYYLTSLAFKAMNAGYFTTAICLPPATAVAVIACGGAGFGLGWYYFGPEVSSLSKSTMKYAYNEGPGLMWEGMCKGAELTWEGSKLMYRGSVWAAKQTWTGLQWAGTQTSEWVAKGMEALKKDKMTETETELKDKNDLKDTSMGIDYFLKKFPLKSFLFEVN